MPTTISNMDDTIDSRDIIERIEELTAQCEGTYLTLEEQEELEALTALAEQCYGYSDWEYGETIISRDYFKKYMDEMVQDCYEIPKDMPFWMTIKLDYVALEQDYISVDFNGEEYLIRSV